MVQDLDGAIERAVAAALEEDIDGGDRTTEATVEPDRRGRAVIKQKAAGVIYGIAVAARVFQKLDPTAAVTPLCAEGTFQPAGSEVVAVEGKARALLSGERTALNFLGHLSGIATAAYKAVQAVAGSGAKVVDTRKTTPGLRLLEKAAVRAGGAGNHRRGLYDALLIKDNHIAAAGSITAAIERARKAFPELASTLEVEVRNLAELEEALAAGAPRILLDNMAPAELAEAVRRTEGRALLEASGGITPERVAEVAATGVDWISLGWLTHSAPSLDLSMAFQEI